MRRLLAGPRLCAARRVPKAGACSPGGEHYAFRAGDHERACARHAGIQLSLRRDCRAQQHASAAGAGARHAAFGEPKAEEGESEEPEKILPKEELRFMTSLKSDAAGGVLADADKASDAAPAVTQEKAAQEKPKPEVQKPREPQFDYVLRVAAFKEPEQAQALLNRLSKDGIRARRTQAKTPPHHLVLRAGAHARQQGRSSGAQAQARRLRSARRHAHQRKGRQGKIGGVAGPVCRAGNVSPREKKDAERMREAPSAHLTKTGPVGILSCFQR